MQPQHLLDLEADGEHRVERRHRLLEDHRDVRAAHALQLARRQAREIAPAVHDLALRVDDRVLGRQQAEDRERRHRLARARLADQRDGRVARNVERDALHRLERRVLVEAEGDREVADADQRVEQVGRGVHHCPALPFSFGSSASRSASVKSENAVTSTRHRAARRGELPPLAEQQLVLRLVQHRAPRHDVDGHAEAQERQDHLGLDERDDEDRHLHEHDVRDVGEDVAEHAAHVRRADRVGRLHVLAALVLQVLGADQPEHAGPPGEAQDEHDRHRALVLQHRRDGEDQQQVRDRAEHAVEPVERVVDPAAVVAGERAQHGADERRDERRGEPDEDRRLRALDRLRDDVAAPLVGAERQRRAALGRRRRRHRPAGGRALAGLDVLHHVGERIDRLAFRRGRGRRRALGALDFLHHVGQRIDEAAGGRGRGAFGLAAALQLREDVADRIDDGRVERAAGRRARRRRGLVGLVRDVGRRRHRVRADERRRRVVDADLARPVARDHAERRQDHQRDERDDDRERHHRDAVGLEAPPGERPQARRHGVRDLAARRDAEVSS